MVAGEGGMRRQHPTAGLTDVWRGADAGGEIGGVSGENNGSRNDRFGSIAALPMDTRAVLKRSTAASGADWESNKHSMK